MNLPTKHWIFRNYLWLTAGVFALSVLAVITFVPGWNDRVKLVITSAGGTVTVLFLVQKQKLEETRLFKELFKEFNARYDDMNENLNRILTDPNAVLIEPPDRDVLYNYFNLCAEEHLYHSQGYIPEEVWRSWEQGMKAYFSHPPIRKVWDNDPGRDSYYGFVPPGSSVRQRTDYGPGSDSPIQRKAA